MQQTDYLSLKYFFYVKPIEKPRFMITLSEDLRLIVHFIYQRIIIQQSDPSELQFHLTKSNKTIMKLTGIFKVVITDFD